MLPQTSFRVPYPVPYRSSPPSLRFSLLVPLYSFPSLLLIPRLTNARSPTSQIRTSNVGPRAFAIAVHSPVDRVVKARKIYDLSPKHKMFEEQDSDRSDTVRWRYPSGGPNTRTVSTWFIHCTRRPFALDLTRFDDIHPFFSSVSNPAGLPIHGLHSQMHSHSNPRSQALTQITVLSPGYTAHAVSSRLALRNARRAPSQLHGPPPSFQVLKDPSTSAPRTIRIVLDRLGTPQIAQHAPAATEILCQGRVYAKNIVRSREPNTRLSYRGIYWEACMKVRIPGGSVVTMGLDSLRGTVGSWRPSILELFRSSMIFLLNHPLRTNIVPSYTIPLLSFCLCLPTF
ncbi:hypothetical protein NMY22_g17937 [Coprinellus aureogranulatus]|nr:hypothetical protein NMY22_g17937 [Coprinellus aureogranulatus]